MFRILLSALLASSAPAAALAQQPAAPPAATPAAADPEAICFIAAAVSARRLERSGEAASQQDRDRRFLLSGVANYYGGRISLRYTAQQLPAILQASVAAAERLPDLAGHATECSGAFLAFMRIVAGQN